MYKTKAGEMFDWIAYKELGSERYLPELLAANADKLNKYKFTVGEELEIPAIDKPKPKLPPWRKQ